jgi:hypothetical protein
VELPLRGNDILSFEFCILRFELVFLTIPARSVKDCGKKEFAKVLDEKSTLDQFSTVYFKR